MIFFCRYLQKSNNLMYICNVVTIVNNEISLTMATHDKTEEKKYYSNEELQEFKELILKKIEDAKKNLDLLNAAVANAGNDVTDTSPTFKTLEEGSSVLSKEENSKLAARQQKFIKDLEAALIRIENKTYGICKVTGKLIPKERLRAVPHTTMTIEAKEMTSKRR